ncbi:MAG: protein-L-isoaspartate(D-aspartate) O-methyltransferase [Terriglobales bacterium]
MSFESVDPFTVQRKKMVDSQLRARGIRDVRVLEAMAKLPRHDFVAEQFRPEAYEDHPIQIGEGQTISQPYIVARMLEALSLTRLDTVLEIGTGSGYQTGLLAELCQFVYSIERHAALAQRAEVTLARLGYQNVKISVGDGSHGLPDKAPFDAITVSAAAPQIPAALFEQLREGGRMILPVGPAQYQELELVRKLGGNPEISRLESCRFVPLIGASGYSVEKY